MSIEQLGSLGEFVAAIAVLISLLYLAVQVRQNTAQSKLAAFNDVFKAYSEMRRSLYTSDSMIEVLTKVIEDRELSNTERLKAETFFGENLFCTLQMVRFSSGTEGFSVENLEEAVRRSADLVGTPIGREYWEGNKCLFPPDFVQVIDSHLMKEHT